MEKLEDMLRGEIFKDSEEISMAKNEIEEQIHEELEEITHRYGRDTTTHALKKAWLDYSNRRWINPHPIPDEEYQYLLEISDQNQVWVNERSVEAMCGLFVDMVRNMPEDKREQVEHLSKECNRAKTYAWIDVSITDLFVEERDEYVEKITDAVMNELEK